jgi:hypothetical protein
MKHSTLHYYQVLKEFLQHIHHEITETLFFRVFMMLL